MTVNSIVRPFRELAYLLFPPVCIGCGNLLNEQESCICFPCEYELAYLNLTPENENVIDEIFWGKVVVEKATAYFQFIPDGISQHLLHALKYKSRPEVGVFLGQKFGYYLKECCFFENVDVIVPVPLHYSRRKERGYNQSEQIVYGMAKVLNVLIDKDTLIRIRGNTTQTDKSKSERRDNVEELFDVQNLKNFANKHVLLVDDVITTGATLEACVIALQKSENVRVSIASLARA